MTQAQPQAVPQDAPTLGRAVVCFLLNVIVFPGLGTLASGEQKRKRAGWAQFGLGMLLLPLLVVTAMGGAIFSGVDPEVVRAWLSNFMMLLVAWNIVSALGILRDAYRARKKTA